MKPTNQEQGLKLSEEIQAFSYVECSAKTKEGLKVVFNDAIEAVMKHNSKSEQTDKKKKKPCLLM